MELRAQCLKALAANDLNQKLNQVQAIYESFKSHQIKIDAKADIKHTYHLPGAPPKPDIVAPRLVEKRSASTQHGKLIFIHALAHIEFSAINLALDIIWRFKNLPEQFYSDWLQIAYEEQAHFNLLNSYLKKFGLAYGSFNAHNSLWEMAERTSHDLIHRLALIPRTMEARGLDVTPPIIEKFKQQRDDDIAAILQTIYEEEIRHVSIGNIWYRWACDTQKLDPHETYKNLLATYDIELNYQKLNKEARYKAGFLKEELI
jgi:uncharacterized ferritin-like protein (DUF455 family)